MSEFKNIDTAVAEIPVGEPDAYSVLSDGEWHPVITELGGIMPGVTQKLAVAVTPEHLFGVNRDDFIFDDGAFFMVDFTTVTLHEYGMNVKAIGHSDQINMPHELYMTPTGDDHSAILLVPTYPVPNNWGCTF